MDAGRLLVWWWVPLVALVLLGHGLALAGLTRPQRAVWTTARITAVRPPEHGASARHGIPVTLAFRDPATGRETVAPYTGAGGHTLREAWVGREMTIRHPPGRPERFRVPLYDGPAERNGRSGPDCLLVLVLTGLVIQLAVTRGHPFALLGSGGLLTLFALRSPDLRDARARDAALATAVAVPARVVAVTTDTGTDGEGTPCVSHVPVVTFTTADGTPVTVLFREDVPDPGRSLGRRLTVHYAPADPALYTADPAAARRSNRRTAALIVALRVLGPAVAAAGALTL